MSTTPDTSAAEYREAARILTEAANGVASTVERMHRAIARRSFGAASTPARPARLLHNGISGLVYTSVRTGITAAGVAATAAAHAVGTRRPPGALLDAPAGRAAAGVLAGAFGERTSIHPATMSLRVDGKEVPIERAALTAAYPEPSDHLVLFLHGLIETERWWYPRPPRDGRPPRVDFGTRAATDLDCTPLYLRYHTGRHISANGADLDALLGALVEQWPTEVRRISIVGHSMGGLVARSAVHSAVTAERAWLEPLSDVVYLGTPHNGAPLELGAHLLSWALRRIPESAPLGELLELRSDGVKDLRYGYLHEHQWRDLDPERLLDPAPRAHTECPDGLRQHCYTVTIARDRDSLLGRLLGDLLVTPNSSDTPTLPATSRHWSGGMNHFHLLHNDEVYERVRDWLSGSAAPSEGSPRWRSVT